MLSIFLFIIAIIATLIHIALKKERDASGRVEVFLSYVVLFNVGFMCLIAAYAHVFMGPETAKSIGWAPGSPFQYEIGMANLSYGVLGILAYRYRGGFRTATIIGWSVLLIGCFIGHMINYHETGNTAPNNMGAYVWFNDLILPVFLLYLLFWLNRRRDPRF